MENNRNWVVMFRRRDKDEDFEWDMWCAPFGSYKLALDEIPVAEADLNMAQREHGFSDMFECAIFVKVTPAILALMKDGKL